MEPPENSVTPSTESLSPNRAKYLVDILEPRVIPPTAEKEDPTLRSAATDTEEPKRPSDLTVRDPSICVSLATVREEPNEADPWTLKSEPTYPNEPAETELPNKPVDFTESVEETDEKPVTLKDPAAWIEPAVLKDDPRETASDTERELLRTAAS